MTKHRSSQAQPAQAGHVAINGAPFVLWSTALGLILLVALVVLVVDGAAQSPRPAPLPSVALDDYITRHPDPEKWQLATPTIVSNAR